MQTFWDIDCRIGSEWPDNGRNLKLSSHMNHINNFPVWSDPDYRLTIPVSILQSILRHGLSEWFGMVWHHFELRTFERASKVTHDVTRKMWRDACISISPAYDCGLARGLRACWATYFKGPFEGNIDGKNFFFIPMIWNDSVSRDRCLSTL
jgi:hypothetical protein